MQALLVWALLASSGQAADLHVTVTNVHNANGRVLVAVCRRAEFLKPHCPWQGRVAAALGSVTAVIGNIPPGNYAVQVFHDENANGVLDRNFLGFPLEGMGFSRDAPFWFGPPGFDAAAIDIPSAGLSVKLRMRYYAGRP